MIKISCFIILCGFLLFRPYQYQSSNLLYSGDDESYLAHATALAYFQFPNYEKEHVVYEGKIPPHSIGPAILASPFVFVFSILDRISDNSVVHQRTRATLHQSWTLFGFHISSSFYLWITCLLAYSSIRQFYSDRVATTTVILLILVQGVPLYVFRRPIFSHVYEIFLQSLLFYIFILHIQNKLYWIKEKKGFLIIGILTSLVILVRPNNIAIALIWIFSFYCINVEKFNIRYVREGITKTIYSVMVLLAIITYFKLFPSVYNNTFSENNSYISDNLDRLLNFHTLEFYIRRLSEILVGTSWGLLYTAPYALIGLFSIYFIKYPWKKFILILLAPLLVNLFIVIQWKTQAGFYGYRYLVFSLFPLLVTSVAYTSHIMFKNKKQYFKYLIFVPSIFPFLSMLCYEGSKTLTLSQTPLGWTNPTFQLDVWKSALFHPIETVIIILKGGPLYCVYLLAHILDIKEKLPDIVLQKYPVFDPLTFVRTTIIWGFPWFLSFLYMKIRKSTLFLRFSEQSEKSEF